MCYIIVMIWFLSCSQPTAQEILDSDIPVPQWEVSELNVHLQEVLEQGMPHAIVIRNEYASFLQHREDRCPNFVTDQDSWVGTWEADCETSQNASFWGTGIFIEFFGMDSPYEMSLQSSFEMSDGERFFSGGGLLSFAHFSFGNEETWEQNIGGSYQLSGGDIEHGWMKNTSSSLTIQSTIKERNQTLYKDTILQGGYSVDDVSLHFENFEWRPQECESPDGQLKIRDTSGYWYTLEFSCDSPCAHVLWYGENMKQQSCLQQSHDLWTTSLQNYFTPWDEIWAYYP
jgi:hypothetical protein